MGQTERIGVGVFTLLVEREIGWIVREQPVEDLGIDAHIEERRADDPAKEKSGNGRMVGVQIKAGSTYLRPSSGDWWEVRVKDRHIGYWLNYSLPVILVVIDIATDAAYWVHVTADTIVRTKRGTPSVRVPKANILSAVTAPPLSKIANATPEQLARTRFTLFSQLVGEIASGRVLYVEGEEWVNKSIGRLDVRVEDEDGDVLDQWLDFTAGSSSVRGLIEARFPWATLEIDEDFYAGHERERYIAEHGSWDREAETIYYDEDECERWVQEQQGTDRAYQEYGSGEVQNWRFKIELNVAGRALLDEFHHEVAKIRDEVFAADEESGGAHSGTYVAEYGETGYREFANVNYYFDDDHEDFDIVYGTEGNLWEDDDSRREMASDILEHHTGKQMPDVVVTAFVNHFNDVFESDPDWSLSSAEIGNWLDAFR